MPIVDRRTVRDTASASDTPRLKSFGTAVPLGGMTPAVTATVQSTYLTGLPPSEHGAVGNGWLFPRHDARCGCGGSRTALVQAPKVWDVARGRPAFTCANLFWWFAMYSIGRL